MFMNTISAFCHFSYVGVATVIACAALSCSTAQAATSKGLFIIIDPYDTTTSICDQSGYSQSGFGLKWLTVGQCPNSTVPNRVISTLQSGQISGIFLHMNWNDYYEDSHNNNSNGLKTAFAAIVHIAIAGSQKFNITLGMGAGTNVPCEVYAQNKGLGPILLPNSSINNAGNPVVACNALPRIWAGPGLPGFADDILTLVATSKSQILNYGAVTGLKLTGVNTKTLELYLVGSPKTLMSSSIAFCSSPTTACNTNAAQALIDDKSAPYAPANVESAWNGMMQTFATLLSASPQLMFEADTTGLDAFPPITASQTGTMAMPNFSCAQGTCVIDNGVSVGPFGLSAAAGDGYYFSQRLLSDLVADGIPTGSLSVQTDGLQNQQGVVNPSVSTEPLPLPCWAYKNLGTTPNRSAMGFQSVNSRLFPFTANDYENGLNTGLNYGAVYEELWPYEIQYYTQLAGSGGGAFFATESSNLVNNKAGALPNGCAAIVSQQ